MVEATFDLRDPLPTLISASGLVTRTRAARGPPRHGTIPPVTPRARSRTLDVLLLDDPHGHDLGQDPLVVRGPGRARGHPRDPLPAGLPASIGCVRRDWTLPRGAGGAARRAARPRGRVPARLLRPEHARRARPVREGHDRSTSIHFAFLIAGVAHIVRRGKRFHLIAVGALVRRHHLNGVYGVLQLLAKVGGGVNLDKVVVGPLTQGQGGVGGINVFGQATGVQGGSFVSLGVFRVNALALDPNHLGIMLCVPILILLPFCAAPRRARSRRGLALAGVIAFCVGVEVLTLSRSRLPRPRASACWCWRSRCAASCSRRSSSCRCDLRLLLVGVRRPRSRTTCARSSGRAPRSRTARRRCTTRSSRSSRPCSTQHPLLGLGLNTFSVYYSSRPAAPTGGRTASTSP